MTHDHYETLQVHPRADAAAIEAAYERLRGKYDPAKLEGAADELIDLARTKRDMIERAYAVLSDSARRARYDAELANQVGVPYDEVEAGEVFDYRPLPPANRAERPKTFDARPSRTAGRAVPPTSDPRAPLLVLIGLLVVVLIAAGVFLFSGNSPGSLVVAAPTVLPTAGPLDQYETAIVQAKTAAEQHPNAAGAWIDYGNMLYDSVQVVREIEPDSPLYQERLPRWLEATVAYSRALQLEPDNAQVRSDMGVSSCFYGAGTNEPQYLNDGLAEVEKAVKALPEDPRVLLNLGQCYVNVQPARTQEALEVWLKIRESQPEESPLAQQAQILIQRYGGG